MNMKEGLDRAHKAIEKHCWADYNEWLINAYGFHSAKHLKVYETGNATCLLPYDHGGSHEWTPDEDVHVDFKE